MTFARKLPFLAFLACLIEAFFFLSDRNLFREFGPAVCVAGLVILYIWGEVGTYPFEGRFKVRNPLPFFGAVLALTAVGNATLAAPAPDWYPTPHSIWLFLPFLLCGAASLARGYQVLPTGASTPTGTSQSFARDLWGSIKIFLILAASAIAILAVRRLIF